MYAPNITDAQRDLKTDDETLATFSLTIYVLGFGLGPLLFAPLSEMYGRALIYRTCLMLFLVCTGGCALSNSIEMLVFFRFAAGSLGAAPVAIGGAVVGDVFEASERGTAMSVYQAGQIISAVVGPPIGGLIGSYASWRWVFWIVCILVCSTPCYINSNGCKYLANHKVERHRTTINTRVYEGDSCSYDQAHGLWRTRWSKENARDTTETSTQSASETSHPVTCCLPLLLPYFPGDRHIERLPHRNKQSFPETIWYEFRAIR